MLPNALMFFLKQNFQALFAVRFEAPLPFLLRSHADLFHKMFQPTSDSALFY